MSGVVVIGTATNLTNPRLVAEWCRLGLAARLAGPGHARAGLRVGEIVVGRLDVLPSLDGVEPGLFELFLLARSGVDVRNRARALIQAHDKLRTAAALSAAGIPHPTTGVVRSPHDPLPVSPPVVIKPRFGSWGKDVFCCSTERAARQRLRALADRGWFRRHGALVQELVETPRRRDLRALVAGRTLVGACIRTAARGEWRTNTALGGSKASATPDAAARTLAVRAARALECDLVGVDLIPLPTGGYAVLELNGAVDFDEVYSLAGRDVFRDAADALELEFPSWRRTLSLTSMPRTTSATASR